MGELKGRKIEEKKEREVIPFLDISIYYLNISRNYIYFLTSFQEYISVSGCVGALRENTSLLAAYAIFLAVILLLEMTCGILGFIFKETHFPLYSLENCFYFAWFLNYITIYDYIWNVFFLFDTKYYAQNYLIPFREKFFNRYLSYSTWDFLFWLKMMCV